MKEGDSTLTPVSLIKDDLEHFKDKKKLDILYPKKTKEEVMSALSLILAQIADCKMRGVSPPIGLIADALALAALYPFGDILTKLKEITTMAFEAAQAAAENGTLAKDSWLLSPERQAFDALLAKDPSAALEQYLNDPRVIKNIQISKAIRSGQHVPDKDREEFRVYAVSEEGVYKRTVLTPVAALKAAIAKQQGHQADQDKYNDALAGWAHEALTHQVFLERKNIRGVEGRPIEDHIIHKEDGHLIDKRVEKVIQKIEQEVVGGLAAVGAAMTKAPEVIIDALHDRIEQVIEKVEIAKEAITSDAAVVRAEELRQEAEKRQQAAIASAQEAIIIEQKVIEKAVVVEQVVGQVKVATAEVFIDENAKDLTKSQADLDKEAKDAKKAALMAKRAAKPATEEKATTIIDALKKHDSGPQDHHAPPISDSLQRNKSHSHTPD